MDVLAAQGGGVLRGRRVGLLAHPASVDASGRHASDVLRDLRSVRLTALFGPEHGFRGGAGAGAPVPDERLAIPVFSLYGTRRSPSDEALALVDVVLCDLQDIGVRCFTYVSTLRLMLEAAARSGKVVAITDRPIPLPDGVDGPMPVPGCAGFVNAISAPLSYGMTPAETARWLVRTLRLDVDLMVYPIPGYRRGPGWGPGRRRWRAPSPALRTWNAAACYAGTVLAEALPALDLQRGTRHAFEGVAAHWLDAESVCARLAHADLEGVRIEAVRTRVRGHPAHAVRFHVLDASRYRPVRAGLLLLHAITEVHGAEQLWLDAEPRMPFFDQLAGTPAVRRALRRGAPPEALLAVGFRGRAAFLRERDSALCYPPRDA